MTPSLFFWFFSLSLGTIALALWALVAYRFFVTEPRRQRRLDRLMAERGLALKRDTSGETCQITFADYGMIAGCLLGRINYQQRALEMPYQWAKRGQFAYLVCLHEIGHWAMGHAYRTAEDCQANILQVEAEAWQWAFQNAGERIRWRSRRRAWEKALLTYELEGLQAPRVAVYREIVLFMTRPHLLERLLNTARSADQQALIVARRVLAG
jgi:hypothetical protein